MLGYFRPAGRITYKEGKYHAAVRPELAEGQAIIAFA
jgi:hypothetical protein